MLYPSAEIRWFFKGVPGSGLESWFRQSLTGVGGGTRTDFYLKRTGKELTVKLREGRVEAKQRQWKEADFVVKRTVTGQMEGWNKWSFDLQEAEDCMQLVRDHPEAWLAVRKRRLMRTFITELDEITETQAGSFPESGCNAELTFLEAEDSKWYSIGLEAFGVSRDLRGLLHSIAEFIFDEDFPLLLTSSNSLGYAAWIENEFIP
jgi:hypothetical protein